MAGNRTVVVGIFRARTQAEEALDALRGAGFVGDDVSILTQNPDGAPEMGTAPDEGDRLSPGTAVATGAVAGGFIGSLAGWLLGVSSLFIPGIGPFLAAGALATTLAGAAVGAGIGAIGGALTGLGVPEEEARWYEGQVRGGGTLVTVRANGRYDEARSILRRHGAYDIETQNPEQIGYGVAGGSSTMEETPSTADSTSARAEEDAHLGGITGATPGTPNRDMV